MNCPLCENKMKRHYRTMMHQGVRGYTDVLSCTKCACTVDLIVKDSAVLHELLNENA